MKMTREKVNFYVETETTLASIDRVVASKKFENRGRFVDYLVTQYEKGELLQERTDTETVSTLRVLKSMISDMHVQQEVLLHTVNTICEINGYDNFASVDEQKAYAIREAEKHVQEKKNAAIIRSLNEQKAGNE